MYKWKMYKSLSKTSIEDESNSEHPDTSHFYRVIILPFVPFIGLSIDMKQDGVLFRSAPISDIGWQGKDEAFICLVDTSMSNDEEEGCSYQQLINNALADGWILGESIQ